MTPCDCEACQVGGLLLFSILLCLKLDWLTTHLSWTIVFSPLFAASAFHAYFTLIVFVRRYLDDGAFKGPAGKGLASLLGILLIFLFEALLCWSLETSDYRMGVVFIPLYILTAVLGIRACQIHGPH